MAPETGVFEWKDRGSLGRRGRGDEERALPSMPMLECLELCLGMDESHPWEAVN